MRFDLHRPPHFYESANIFFLTGRTLNQENWLVTNEKKKIFLKVLNNLLQEFNIKIYAWVVLDNHYHLLFFLPQHGNLARFINRLHSVTALLLNRRDNTPGRKVWQQYWDHTIRNEVDFWKHFNYIHHNPVKHECVKSQQDCCNYAFCSAQHWVKKNGENWLDSCFEKYPIVDFTVGE